MTATDDAREVLAAGTLGYPEGRVHRVARTLLALAEPDEQVVEAAARAMAARISEPEWTEFLDDARAALTAAVAAAEEGNRG